MINNDTHELEEELKQAGASLSEARSLAGYAQMLHELKGQEPPLGRTVTDSAAFMHARPRFKMLATSLIAAGALAFGLTIASIAQTAYPGTLLYPVKRLTENVAVIIQPTYRGALMMRRAQEVKQLVALRESPHVVNATLQSYKTEVAQYKGDNYADFEYCDSMLSQAETMATGPERLAIAETIASNKSKTD